MTKNPEYQLRHSPRGLSHVAYLYGTEYELPILGTNVLLKEDTITMFPVLSVM